MEHSVLLYAMLYQSDTILIPIRMLALICMRLPTLNNQSSILVLIRARTPRAQYSMPNAQRLIRTQTLPLTAVEECCSSHGKFLKVHALCCLRLGFSKACTSQERCGVHCASYTMQVHVAALGFETLPLNSCDLKSWCDWPYNNASQFACHIT